MKKQHFPLYLLVAVIGFAAIMLFGPWPERTDMPEQNVQTIPAQQFANKLKNTDGVLLDVRTPAEFAAGHIEGAENVNFYDDDFAERIAALDRSEMYFVYCQSDNRSGRTVEKMKELGFTSIIELDGGMNAWEATELPTVSSEEG